MENIETLKQELITQKQTLISKGIEVSTAHTNPSPHEITLALNSVGEPFYKPLALTLFEGTDNARSIQIYIPDGVTAIRNYCFCEYADLITGEIALPSSLKIIGKSAFNGTNPTKINLPEGLETIRDLAFGSAENLIELTIPNSVTSIGASIISSCTSLTKLVIGTGLTTFQSLINNLTSLEEVTIPANIQTIGTQLFYKTPNLLNAYFESNNTTFSSATGLCTNANSKFKIWVDFSALAHYYNATNFVKARPYISSKYTIEEGVNSFPVATGTNAPSLKWYATLNDIENKTNQITAPNEPGEYYCRVV